MDTVGKGCVYVRNYACYCSQKEEVNLRANVRKESQKRRIRERHAQKGGLTASYLEPDRELDLEDDIGAIKSSVRSRVYKAYDSEEGSSDEERQRLLQAKKDDEGTKRGERGMSVKLCNCCHMLYKR